MYLVSGIELRAYLFDTHTMLAWRTEFILSRQHIVSSEAQSGAVLQDTAPPSRGEE
jgi:hypothetical protein